MLADVNLRTPSHWILDPPQRPTIIILSFVASCWCHMYFVQKIKTNGKNWEKLCAFLLPMIDKIGSTFRDFRGPKFQIFWGSMLPDPPTISLLAGAKCQLGRCPDPKNAALSLNRSCKQHHLLLISAQNMYETRRQYSDRLPQLKCNKRVTKKRLKLKWC